MVARRVRLLWVDLGSGVFDLFAGLMTVVIVAAKSGVGGVS